MTISGGQRQGSGAHASSWVARAWLATLLPASALAQGPVTVGHEVTARVEAVALVRDVSSLTPAADTVGISAGSVVVVATAPFTLELRSDASSGIAAVRLPGGAWMPLSSHEWVALAELPNGRHALVLEYRVEAVPGTAPPTSPSIRAVVR